VAVGGMIAADVYPYLDIVLLFLQARQRHGRDPLLAAAYPNGDVDWWD
jgi:hypothetical protein